MGVTLDQLFESWERSASVHQVGDPAGEDEIVAVEQEVKRRLPEALWTIYRHADGASLFSGNLRIYPLRDPQGFGLVDAADVFRREGWQIPDEVLVFGDAGAGTVYGLWLPGDAAPGAPVPVVAVAETFEPACMAVVGTDLIPFLVSISALYAQLIDAPAAALDALGVPDDLRDPVEPAAAALRRWADPALGNPEADPYVQGMDAEDLRKLLGVTAQIPS
ncbi:MAG TPA: SMI1/KNR4 family protein [Thermoanaerobaculia bacterium]|nr:SMI1/KNR4 family protein [Thermoanaerobaculia bacterium]